MSVSVIIPTTGRESLRRALVSALTQTLEPSEILILPDELHEVRGIVDACDPRIRIVPTTKVTAGRKRQLGTEHATGTHVAYLDDDDWWEDTKLSRQLTRCGQIPGDHWLLSGPMIFHSRSSADRIIPVRPPRPEENMISYLLERPGLRSGTGAVPTSSILLPRTTALLIGWNDIPKHQDWDFVIRAAATGVGVHFTLGPPIGHIWQGSPSSISAQLAYAHSENFVRSLPQSKSRALADFVATYLLPAATDWKDLRTTTELFLNYGRPHLAASVTSAHRLIRRFSEAAVRPNHSSYVRQPARPPSSPAE